MPKAKPLPKVRKLQAFKGNDTAAETLKVMARFPALRALGKPTAEQLKEFGLDKDEVSLTLSAGSTSREFIIGERTYGNNDYYVKDKEDGRVYVVHSRRLKDLQYAEYRMPDRSLLATPTAEIDRLVVRSGKGRKALVQTNAKDARNAFWSKEGAPKKRNDLYSTFISKLLRLRANEYVLEAERPKKLEELMVVEVFSAGRQIGWIKLYRGVSTTVSLQAKTQTADYLAETSNTRALVKVPRSPADEVASDIDAIIGD